MNASRHAVFAGALVACTVLGPNELWPTDEIRARRVVGTQVKVSPDDIDIEIHPAMVPFHVGDPPVFRVVLRNTSQKTFSLVGAIDNSDDKERFPHVTVTIEGPKDGVFRPRLARCGNVNPLNRHDFVTLEPGDAFEPITLPFWPPSDANHAHFVKPGQFKVTFRYSSNAIDCVDWDGWQGRWPMRPDIVERLKQVPRLELADSILVTVLE